MQQKKSEKNLLQKNQPNKFSFSLESDYLLDSQIGENGISAQELSASKSEIQQGFNKLTAKIQNIKLLNICDDDSQIKLAQNIASEIRENYNKLIIYGIGGSSLGGQALCGTRFYQYLNKNSDVEIVFIDNIHYHNFSIFLNEIDFENTAFLTISKSGNTLETISQILVTIDFFKEKIAENDAKNLYFLTENENSNLGSIAKSHSRPIIPHSKEIGGRYSCFTAVSMIPAFLCGIDLDDFVRGGKNIIDDFLNEAQNSIVFEGATILNAMMKKGYNTHVFIPYLQRLYQTTYWYAQLLAESLGKDGKGMTPIKAIGSVDQHSQLQLFLDGPKDKFFTFITQSTKNLGSKILFPEEIKNKAFFHNKTLGDVINANQDSTISSLVKAKCPVRNIRFEKFDDVALGEILMFFMLETILLGYSMNIDPFDQPAVEIGKKIAKDILSK